MAVLFALRARASSEAPDFQVKDLDGKTIQLSAMRGKVVVLDFWATWCPPCRKEIPHFIELQDAYGSKGLQVVGLSVDQEGEGVVRSFADSTGINYPVAVVGQDLGQKYGGIRGIPTTFIIDQKGRIVQKYVGYQDKQVFESQIQALLADGPPAEQAAKTSGSGTSVQSVATSPPFLAISKEELKPLSAALKDKVFGSFSDVKLHYLLTSDGNSLVEKIAQTPGPGDNLPSGFFIRFYIYPELAEKFRQESQRNDGREYVIRTTTMDKILHAMYDSVGRPPPQSLTDAPEFIIYEPWTFAVFEMFVDKTTQDPWVTESPEGGRFIPAFISEEAIAFEKNMDLQKYMRRGQDFRSFLRTVEQFASTETPVVVYGFGNSPLSPSAAPEDAPADSRTGPVPAGELERPELHFDERKWELGFQDRQDRTLIAEFVLQGETVENWSELVTAQLLLGLQGHTAMEGYLEHFKNTLSETTQHLTDWNVISKTKTSTMFEWRVRGDPQVPDQYELGRVIMGKDGLHHIHYAVKKAALSPEQRMQWIDLLNSVRIIPGKNSSKPAAEDLQFALPEKWVFDQEKSDAHKVVFSIDKNPSIGLTGYVRTFPSSPQTALEWAMDEAEQMESKGYQIVQRPAEEQVGETPWIGLAWERTEASGANPMLFRGEQYYLKQGHTMGEVVFVGLRSLFEDNRSDIVEFLADVRFSSPGPNARSLQSASEAPPKRAALQVGMTARFHLDSGETLQGVVLSEEEEGWWVKVKAGESEGETLINRSSVLKVEPVRDGEAL